MFDLLISGAQVVSGTLFGQGNGSILARDFQCTGEENDLDSCDGDNICCSHVNDVGIVCQPACSHGDTRLVDGSRSSEGRVEVCQGVRWGTVCDEEWTTEDARVTCRQIGLPWRGQILYVQ